MNEIRLSVTEIKKITSVRALHLSLNSILKCQRLQNGNFWMKKCSIYLINLVWNTNIFSSSNNSCSLKQIMWCIQKYPTKQKWTKNERKSSRTAQKLSKIITWDKGWHSCRVIIIFRINAHIIFMKQNSRQDKTVQDKQATK